jgi:hypothetical protein
LVEDGAQSATHMVSLSAVCNGTTAIYGESLSSTALDWAGNTNSSITALTAADLKDLLVTVMRRRTLKPTATVVNSLQEQKLYESQSGDVRYYGNDTLDEYGFTHRFNGIPIVTDENVPDACCFLFQKADVKLHVFRDFAPLADGGKATGFNNQALIVDQSNLAWDVPIEGYFNLRAERRNGCAAFTALT